MHLRTSIKLKHIYYQLQKEFHVEKHVISALSSSSILNSRHGHNKNDNISGNRNFDLTLESIEQIVQTWMLSLYSWVPSKRGDWKILEKLINGLGGQSFLWYDKIEYKEAEEFWVAVNPLGCWQQIYEWNAFF